MVRARLLLLLIIASGVLLLAQVFILQSFLQQVEEVEFKDPLWESIKVVTDESLVYGLPLFIIDRTLLYAISKGGSNNNGLCQLICREQNVTHLGTFSQLVSQVQRDYFVQKLRQVGFDILEFSGHDPSLIHHDMIVEVPLHYLIKKDGIIIHIVIFHERTSGFWWHGQLAPHASQKDVLLKWGVDLQNFSYGGSPGAYDRVEVLPALVDTIKLSVPSPTTFIQSPQEVNFIECNYSRAKLFYSLYKRDESDEANIFRTKAWKLLAKAQRLLDSISVPFWLSSGTCLGYFRQCDFIPYSKDVDIGIWIKDYKPDIIPTFSTHDLPLTHLFGKVEDSLELSFRDGDIKLDVFFFYKEDNYVWNGGTQARTGLKFKYIFPTFTLCWTEFLELKVRVPCQTEAYIESNYGKKWFEPTPVWDWKSSPPNVEKNGHWPIEEWPDVIQLIPLPEQN